MTAWLKRFVFNARHAIPSNRIIGPLSVLELNEATTTILKMSQTRAFGQKLTDLKANRPVGRRSILRTLNPFLDESGLYDLGAV